MDHKSTLRSPRHGKARWKDQKRQTGVRWSFPAKATVRFRDTHQKRISLMHAHLWQPFELDAVPHFNPADTIVKVSSKYLFMGALLRFAPRDFRTSLRRPPGRHEQFV